MPLRHLVVAHHRFPDMKLEVTEILHPSMLRTRKKCSSCAFLINPKNSQYAECQKFGWLIPKELLDQPWPCEGYKHKQNKRKRRKRHD